MNNEYLWNVLCFDSIKRIPKPAETSWKTWHMETLLSIIAIIIHVRSPNLFELKIPIRHLVKIDNIHR